MPPYSEGDLLTTTEPKAGPDRGSKAPVLLLLLAVLAVAALLVALRPAAEERPAPDTTELAVDPAGPQTVTFTAPGGPGEPTSVPSPGGGGGEVVLGGPGGPDGPHGMGTGPAGTFVGGPDPVDPETPEHRATGVRGRVTTSAGAPVAGAKVQLRGQRPGPQGMTMMLMQSGPDGELEAAGPNMTRSREATTDADGRYEVTGLDAAYTYEVRASLPPGGPADLLPGKGPAPKLQAGAIVEAKDVALTRAGRLEGTTRGPDGRPLAGVRVTLGGGGGILRFGGPGDDEGEMSGGVAVRRSVSVAVGPGPDGPEGDAPGERQLSPFGGKSTKSDEAGRFVFERVAAGRHELEGAAKGLRAARLEVTLAEGEARRDCELRLAEGLAVSVRVTDDQGTAVAGATVRAQAGFGPMPGRGASASTDAQGQARLEGLSSSELTLQVQADGYASYVADVALGAGDPATARLVILEPGASVTGRLVDGAGAPVTKGFVMLEPLVHGGDVNVQAGADQQPGPDGRFRIRGVRKGSWRLRAHCPGVAPGSATVEVAGRGDVDVGDVVCAALLGIDVVVQDPDGAPVEGAVVEAGLGGGGMMVAIMAVDSDSKGEAPAFMAQRQGRTGVDGRAHLEGLEPGGYTVRASCPPFADGWGEARVVAGTPPDPVTVQLTEGGKVEGRVLPAAGEPSPPPPTSVSLFRRGREMPVSSTKSGPDGAFFFERVSPGEYRLGLGLAFGGGSPGPGGSPAKADWFRVDDGASVTRSLERPPSGTVEGVVRDAAGAPLAGAEVGLGFLDTFRPGDPGVMAQKTTRTDAAGRFRFEALAPGRQGLSVRAGDRLLAFSVDVGAGAPTRRDLTVPAEAQGSPVRVPVTDEGAAKAGARVLLERTDDGPLVRREATTGQDGVARFEGIPSGSYTLSASAPGRARTRGALVVTGPADAAPLALAPGVALLLAVRAEGGLSAPVESRVVLRPIVNGAPATDPTELRFTTVDVGGQIRIDGLSPGVSCEVTIDAQGFAQAKATFAPQSADPTSPEVVTLRPE
jgi:protocatechuate 3,4-dioxygenase beta subunit